MDRIEHNTITWRHDEDGWSLPVRFDLLRTAHWIGAARIGFSHTANEIAFNRIFIFRQGGCRITHAGKTHRLQSHRIYLLPIDMPFDVRYPKGCEIYAFHFQFSTSTGRDIFRQAGGIRSLNDPALCDEITAGVAEPQIHGTLRWQLALFLAASRLAGPLMASVFEQEKETSDFRDLLEFIQISATPELTLAKLARRMNTTRAALSKRFVRVMGFPLKQCLIQTAMRKAEALVVRRDLTIQQIAHELGYKDPFYFHRVFKRHTGMTPVEYRERARRYR